MSFSKEDKAAWFNSEIMKEFEKVAQEEKTLEGPSPESSEPVSLEEGNIWEEEDSMEKFDEALEEFNEPTLGTELKAAYNKMLIENLGKIANGLAENKNIKAAYRVETTLHELQDLFREERNG